MSLEQIVRVVSLDEVIEATDNREPKTNTLDDFRADIEMLVECLPLDSDSLKDTARVLFWGLATYEISEISRIIGRGDKFVRYRARLARDFDYWGDGDKGLRLGNEPDDMEVFLDILVMNKQIFCSQKTPREYCAKGNWEAKWQRHERRMRSETCASCGRVFKAHGGYVSHSKKCPMRVGDR
jgi:hypothetical protein